VAGVLFVAVALSIAMAECGVPVLLRSVVTFGIGWGVIGPMMRRK
jgi:hypothetical protein